MIPPGELRDVRELLRTRMALRDLRTSLKHRIHGAIDRFGLHNDAISDLFGRAGREFLIHQLTGLPPETYAMLLTELMRHPIRRCSCRNDGGYMAHDEADRTSKWTRQLFHLNPASPTGKGKQAS